MLNDIFFAFTIILIVLNGYFHEELVKLLKAIARRISK